MFCRHIAASNKVKSIFSSSGLTEEGKPIEVLNVIESFKPRLMSYFKFFDNRAVLFLAVDSWVFERDVDRGFLGDAIAIRLAFPYIPLANKDYLKNLEVNFKRRLIREILENLAMSYPELSYEIRIKPEYFAYETLLSRLRLYPPMIYDVADFLREDLREENLKCVMEGYLAALSTLEKENVVERVNGFFMMRREYVDQLKKTRPRVLKPLKSAQKTIFMSLIRTFPKFLEALAVNRDMLKGLQFSDYAALKSVHHIEDPENYLFAPTATGLVSLAVKMDVKTFARKVLSAEKDIKISVEEIGGVLNDVYLVEAFVEGEVRRAVAKSFKEWSSLKWFPISLWTIGTRTFALSARLRLERECAFNHYLHTKGFSVPKLLGVSHRERLVFMEYIEGETLEKFLKKILSSKRKGEVKEESSLLERVGEVFARVHSHGIVLGDTKPENILVGKEKEIYLLDFEQATRGGDKAWDIAEFLYYIGHYASPISDIRPLELAVETFIKGYLKGGGSLEVVKKVGTAKYTKVFSIFVFPNIILAISNICRRAYRFQSGDEYG
jgi:tRNA A-37 threonylcarbamoyl transferase component Bud32